MSERSCVVYPRCPLVVVLSELWICYDDNLLNSSSRASLDVDTGLRLKLDFAKVAGECPPPCSIQHKQDEEQQEWLYSYFDYTRTETNDYTLVYVSISTIK